MTVLSPRLFQTFKYLIYALLLVNTAYFLVDDMSGAAHTFRAGITISNVVNALRTFVDSASWFILLVIFELETFVISDERLRGGLRHSLDGVIAVAYAFVIYAFVGYSTTALLFYDFTPVDSASACGLVGEVESYALGLDDYKDLTAETCADAPAGALWVNSDVSMVAERNVLTSIRQNAMTDVVNAGTWVLVVLVLWADVWLQLGGGISQRLYTLNVYVKGALYGVLIVCALYWMWLWAWIDAWDAWLWILAFFAIELNLFSWHEEVQNEQDQENRAA